uniref:Translocase of inner mitochondrial membrane 29 n=1 Tax=Neolamprologus brichardi TaxID=32507 RepID=A0A3Q4GNA1_NEOBR
HVYHASWVRSFIQLIKPVNTTDVLTELGLLSPWIRSGISDVHVQSLVKLRNEGRLRHASLGLLSVVYYADYDPDAMLYEAQCSNLSVPWREIPQRVLDIGFAGNWWILDSKMKDYDVNEDEFKHLPVHMQVTSPPSVEKVERNEKLHKDSWLPVSTERKVKRSSLALTHAGQNMQTEEPRD